MNTRKLFPMLFLWLGLIGTASAQYCVSGVFCWCTDYLIVDRGWGDFDGAGDAKRWYGAAEGKGYITRNIPIVGAVLVWDGWSTNTAGHVAEVIEVIDSSHIKVTHSNWSDPFDGQVRTSMITDTSSNWTKVKVGTGGERNTFGFIYPKGAETKLAYNSGHAWIPASSGNDSCENGVKFFRIGDNGKLTEVSRQEACGNIETSCASPPSESQVEGIENSAERTFWQKLWNAITNGGHFLFGTNIVQACGSTVEYRTFTLPGSSSSASYMSSGNKIGSSGPSPVGVIPQPVSGSKPDITPDYDVFSDAARTHEVSANCSNCPGKPVGVGQVIYHRLEAQVSNRDVVTSDLRNGNSQSIDGKVECRVAGYTDWQEIPGSENELEYDVVNLDANGVSIETIPYTVPNYSGSTLECRARVDDDDEVIEENEGNNGSRTERFPIRAYGQCNIIVEYAGLVNGASVVNLGSAYGLEMMVSSIGATACENDVRSSYALKKPGESSFTQVGDDGTEADDYLCFGCRGYEYTTNTPFVATTVGVHTVRTCADYQGANAETNEGDNCRESVFEVIDPNAVPVPVIDPNAYEQVDPAVLHLLFD